MLNMLVFYIMLKALFVNIFWLLLLINLFNSELNNMGIWYRMGNVPRAQDSTHTPTTNNIQNMNSCSSSAPVPAAPMPKYVYPNNVFVHVCDNMCPIYTLFPS